MPEQTQKTLKQRKSIWIVVALLIAALLGVQPVGTIQAAASNESAAESVDPSTDSPVQAPEERYCDRPTLPNVTSTEHFQINYGEIPPPLTIEDFEEALEAAYQLLIVDYGWAEPPLCAGALSDSATDLTGMTCFEANPWGKYPVVIDDSINGLGYVTDGSADEDIAGSEDAYYTGWVGDNPNTAAIELDAKATCMALKSDYSGEDEGTELDVLKGTAVHEYAHSIQLGVGDPLRLDEDGDTQEEDTMWYESYASYTEQEIVDEGDTNHVALFPNMGTIELPNEDSEDNSLTNYPICLGHYPEGNSFAYTNWPFFQHIAENFGGANRGDATNTGTAGENINFQIWENIAQGERGLTALENALGGQSVLQSEYHNYSLATALMFDGGKGCGDGYVKPYCLEEGAAMAAYDESTATTTKPGPNGSISNIPGTYTGEIADHYTANYIKLPAASDDTMFDVQLSASDCGNVALRASLVCDSGSGSTITSFPDVISAGQSAKLTQQTLASCTSAYVVVTNEYDSGNEVDSCAACGYTLAVEQSQTTPVETEMPSPVPTATPTATSTATSQLTQAQLDEFTQFVQDEMAESTIPGVAVAIIQGDEVVLVQGFGTKDGDGDDPVTNETLFHIGSTHKSMTAMMIATMVDENLLSWDSRAVDIDDEFTLSDVEATEQVTLRHLLSMRGGIRADSEDELYEGSTVEEIFTLMETESLLGMPGTEFEYSNISYALSGYLAAMADGESFDDLYDGYARSLQKRVLDPIGMNNATIYASIAQSSPHLSKPHENQGEQKCAVTQSIDVDGDSLAPSGSLKANIDDMARYIMTQVNQGVAPNKEEVVSAENLMTTWEPQGPGKYGLGWERTTISGVDLVSHEGGYDSFLSVIGLMPALNTGFVILTNCGDGAEPLIEKAPERLITLLNQASVVTETPTEEPTVTPQPPDTDTDTDTENVSDEITEDDDVVLSTFAPSYVVAGQNIVYEITFHNKSLKTLGNIKIESAIPANSTYIGGGERSGSKVQLTVSRVAAGASETLTYTVQVNEDVSVGTNIKLDPPSLDGYYTNADDGALTIVEAEGEVVALYRDEDGVAFDVTFDSFKFENYGNDSPRNFSNDLGPADMFAFFGPQVCQSGNTADTCVLSGPARRWMRAEIADAGGGHCEGMAVVSLRLFDGLDFKGKTWPEDYQSSAEDNADLTFPDDALENYILYYFIPQSFQEVKDEIITDSPNNILDKLIEGFQQEPPIAYTVGFYMLPDFEGGHAVTPYGIEKVTEGEYRILLYDNNYPRQKQYITVDREADTWRYVTSATPGEEPDAYTGTADSGNLEITAVSARDLEDGQYFTCPFCPESDDVQASQNNPEQTEMNTIRFEYANEGAFLVVDANDKMTGYDFNTETFVNEIPDARVTHYKGGLGKKIPPMIEIDYAASDVDEEISYDVFISGKTIVSPTDGILTITGEGYAVGLDYIELDPDELLQIKVYPDGTALDFFATETVLAPLLYVSYDPVSAEEPSVIFELDNVTLDAEESVFLDLDPDAEWVALYDSGGLGQEFNLDMILIWPDGDEEVFTQIITMPEGTHDASVDFGAWDGLLDPPLYIDNALQNPSVNHRLEMVNTVSTFDSTSQENAQAGVVSIAATYQNNSEVSLENIYFDVVELDGGNVLLNEGIQTSTSISIPATLLGDDGILDPLESFTFTLKVGIASQTPFQFHVNANGTPVEWLPGEQPLPASDDDVSGQAFALDVGANVFDEEAPTALTEIEEPLPIQLFLPLIKR